MENRSKDWFSYSFSCKLSHSLENHPNTRSIETRDENI